MRKQVIVIEDEEELRKGWVEFLDSDVDVECFDEPDAFAEKYTCHSNMQNVACIILDFQFDTYTIFHKHLCSYIRDDLGFKGKIALWTIEDHLPSRLINQCDVVLPKRLMEKKELFKWLSIE